MPDHPDMHADETPRAGILVSDLVARHDGDALLRACAAAGLAGELVVLDPASPLGGRDAARVTCALLSVDLIGDSSKLRIDPALAHFVEALRAAPRLAWLQVCSAGMDRPIYGELRARGVRLASGAGTNARAVAHSALAGMLALARGLPQWVDAQREHRWAPMRGEASPAGLEGQTAVVIGMGAIGLDIGRMLSAVGLRVIGVRRTPAAAAGFERVVSSDALDGVLPEADWLVLACPLTPGTRGLIGAARLARMRANARLVNVARGEVIDEPALIDALRRKRIAGAYLDVFAVEPLPRESALWAMDGVLISPHGAGSSQSHQRNVVALFCRNLSEFATGRPLINEWRPSPKPNAGGAGASS